MVVIANFALFMARKELLLLNMVLRKSRMWEISMYSIFSENAIHCFI